jgi:hypothetical protein
VFTFEVLRTEILAPANGFSAVVFFADIFLPASADVDFFIVFAIS